MVDILTLDKSKIGKEDLELQTDNQPEETFTVTGPDGNLLTLTKIAGDTFPWTNAYTRVIRPKDIITKGPWVDVRAFGAKGDGVTDDTQAINNALAANQGGLVCLEPNKTYLVSDIQPVSFVTFDLNGSTLKFIGGSGTMVKNDSGTQIQYFAMKNGYLRTNTEHQGVGIQVAHMLSCRFIQLDIRDFDTGIKIAPVDPTTGGGNYYNTFYDCSTISNNNGVHFFTPASGTYRTNNMTFFFRGRFNNNHVNNLLWDGEDDGDGNLDFHGSQNLFFGSDISSIEIIPTNAGISANIAPVFKGNGFIDCRMEYKATCSISIFGANSSDNLLLRAHMIGAYVEDFSGNNVFEKCWPYPFVRQATTGWNVFGADIVGDSVPRFAIVQGATSPRIEMGPGDASRDVNLYREAANAWKTDDQFFPADGIVLKIVSGPVSDDYFVIDRNGLIAIDALNGRIYFRYGDAWHYCAQTAGFEINKDEKICPICQKEIKPQDIVVGRIDSSKQDGALHGHWIHYNCIK